MNRNRGNGKTAIFDGHIFLTLSYSGQTRKTRSNVAAESACTASIEFCTNGLNILNEETSVFHSHDHKMKDAVCVILLLQIYNRQVYGIREVMIANVCIYIF